MKHANFEEGSLTTLQIVELKRTFEEESQTNATQKSRTDGGDE